MRVLSYSLLFFFGGLIMIPTQGGLALVFVALGACGLIAATLAWAWGVLTGRFPAISVGGYPDAQAARRPPCRRR